LKPGNRIALIGPNADDAQMQWGNYNPIPEQTITLADALRERVPGLVTFRGCGIVGTEYMPQSNHPFAQAMDMTDEQLEAVAKQYAVGVADVKRYIDREKLMRSSFLPQWDKDAVLKQLEGIDIVIFAGGISPRFEGEEMPVELPGFKGGDRTDIELPQVQRLFLKALHDAGKKVVLVNFSGCAIGLEAETESCDAILQAWYPGEEGGAAIADVLFGDVAPSGKLPVTFYRHVDQLPDFEDYSMKGRTYRYFTGSPLFAFGHGLSYTTFQYGKARVRGNSIEIPVRNTGNRDADEVVQLYVRRPSDAEGPLKSLRAFRRVTVPSGKTVKVYLPLTEETFLGWSEAAQDMVPLSGKWELLYGGSSDVLQSISYNRK
ncbi:MAG: glycoside hydrolase family 3 C-terminal domain-containing protein, partial [Bacteroidales bacterium]|nr:glycoside hydrolase family 3 C-terminal domain-containing protein [Bacteroidales bacterium]